MLIATAGGAIDFNRWHSAKRVTGDALDAAVLAAARTLHLKPGAETEAIEAARAYFKENTASKVDLAVNTIDFAIVDNGKAIAAIGEAAIRATLLNIVGFETLLVASESGSGLPKANLAFGGMGASNVEIALMLDVTGSMCADGSGPCTSSTKMDGLKDAAHRLIDLAIANDQSKYYSKMSLIPFSTRVRVGPDGGGADIMKRLTDLDATWSGWYTFCTAWTGGGTGSETNIPYACTAVETTYHTNWKVMPCVTDRFYSSSNTMDVTDDAPGPERWLNAHGGDRMTKSSDSTDETPTSLRGTSQTDGASHWNFDTPGGCADVAESNQMLPLTSDKSKLKSRIDGLQAFGSTAGALGTAFSWYTLSPKWASIWGGDSQPGTYDDLKAKQENGKPKLRKVAILVSDGVYNTFRGWKEQNQQDASNYAKQLCTNMKAEGIEIFTVGIALNELPDAERAIAIDTLQSCGTDVEHFFSTLNVKELEGAFQTIATQLSPIYLTR